MNNSNPNLVPIEAFLQSGAFTALFEAVQNFCQTIENAPGGKEDTFIQVIQKQLVALYNAGFQIPPLGYNDDCFKIDVDVDVTNEEKQFINRSISNRIPFSYYWIALDPFKIETTPDDFGLGDLGDDLLDIYTDLKQALLTYNSSNNYAGETAVWQLEFGFNHHWGEHCINALQAIHRYVHYHNSKGNQNSL